MGRKGICFCAILLISLDYFKKRNPLNDARASFCSFGTKIVTRKEMKMEKKEPRKEIQNPPQNPQTTIPKVSEQEKREPASVLGDWGFRARERRMGFGQS